ncbi:hypothetical protein ACHAXS_012576 [Conticribra weissflogii]
MTKSKSKNKGKAVASSAGAPPTRRAWFSGLPSAEERAAASAITDSVFIRMFLDIVTKKVCDIEDGNKLTFEQAAAIYEEYSRGLDSKDPKAPGIEIKRSEGDDVLPGLGGEQVPAPEGTATNVGVGSEFYSNANAVEANTAGGVTSFDGNSAETDGNCGDANSVVAEGSDPADGKVDGDHKEETKSADVMTKEELSCLEPVANVVSAECNRVINPDNSVDKIGRTDAISEKPGSESDLPATLPSTERESKGEIVPFTKALDTLLPKVRVALTSSLSDDVFDLGRLISGKADGQISSPKIGANCTGKRERCGEEGMNESYLQREKGGVEALMLDPSCFKKENNQFYMLADEALRILARSTSTAANSCKEKIPCSNSSGDGVPLNEGGFLSDNGLVSLEGSSFHWPSWILPFCSNNAGGTKHFSLALLLLAGFDFSIDASYRRWLMTHHEGRSAASQNGKSDEVFQPIDFPKSCDHESRIREGLLMMYQVGSILSSNNGKIITLIPEDDYIETKQLIGMKTSEIDLYDMLAVPLLRYSSQIGMVEQSWSKTISKIFRNLKEKWTTENVSTREGSMIDKVDHPKLSGCADVMSSKKGSNARHGQCSGLRNKGGVTGRSAQPAPSKKGKKKKKKKKRKGANADKSTSSEVATVEDLQNVDGEESDSEANVVDERGDAEETESEAIITQIEKKWPAATAIILPSKLDGESHQIASPDKPNADKVERDSSKESLAKPNSDVATAINKNKLDAEAKSSSKPLNEPRGKESPESVAGIDPSAKVNNSDDADDSAWETVEHKARGRKAKSNNVQFKDKGNRVGNNNPGRHDGASSTCDGGNSSGVKKNRKGKQRDKRRRDQKVVKEVIFQILDAVDDEVTRRRKQPFKSASDDKRRINYEKRMTPSNGNQQNNVDQRRKGNSGAAASSGPAKPMKSLRDIVAGSAAATTIVPKTHDKRAASSAKDSQNKAKEGCAATKGSKIKPGLTYKSVIEPDGKPSKPKPYASVAAIGSKLPETKGRQEIVVDDTVNSGGKVETIKQTGKSTQFKSMPDNSSASVDDKAQTSASITEDEATSPPLSTLLGPDNTQSASSSVASSLEAPHSSRLHHKTATENDVGYHLLNVCGQLSDEINTFMSRRAAALDIRRKERGAVLNALQDTLGKIWPGCCHVEMYGSCATQLDLPSSDLDLVVCGLDELSISHHTSDHTPPVSSQNSPCSFHNEKDLREDNNDTMNVEPIILPDHQPEDLPRVHHGSFSNGEVGELKAVESYSQDYQIAQQEFYYAPQNYFSPFSLNAQRVIRLASELELQPWAVQVKAIPTATVPVVKMLADPSRLPGAVGTGGSWIMQQHISGQNGAPPLSPGQNSSPPNQFFPQSKSPSHYYSNPSLPPWRGADIMNGLQPVDITFEGPEHGGIGSTTYSACVVQDCCNETGLPPDSTPIVQVAMVLKELLAQRRLNEPFSGGLSSYALLLLLLAVIKDRTIIQQEMERIEKQRQEVTSDSREVSSSGEVSSHGLNDFPKEPNQVKENFSLTAAEVVNGKGAFQKMNGRGTDSAIPAFESSSNANAANSKPNPSSSWASIAKKSNGSTVKTEATSTLKSTNSITTLTTNTGVTSTQAVAPEEGMLKSANQQASNNSQIEKSPVLQQSKKTAPVSQVIPSSDEKKLVCALSPQGSNDVLDVLCSGELTSGKLLLHFLLFYGQYFDAQSTLVDINSTHHPDFGSKDARHLSPFTPRPPGGTIDPVTGMFSVDPIIVYDPLEGAMDHNVAKRCYCWNNVRWVFAQCYMTVSSVVEESGSCCKSSSQSTRNRENLAGDSLVKGSVAANAGKPDMTNPVLELLLSF